MKRRLVESPDLWRWSSLRADSTREAGPVAVNAWQELKDEDSAASLFSQLVQSVFKP